MAPSETQRVEPVDDRRVQAFRPIRLQKAADAVVAVLVDALRGGLYQPGDLLPRERDLAEQLEVSRPVIREAIDVLRRAGIVTVKRGPSGGATVVSTAALSTVVANLRGALRENMVHVAEMRRLLDLPVTLFAAERASDDELTGLSTLVDELSALPDDADAELTVRVDAAFHSALGRLTANPLLAAHYQSVLDQAIELTRQFPILIVPVADAARNQRGLYAAVLARDPDRIRTAVGQHLDAFEQIYFVDPPKQPGR